LSKNFPWFAHPNHLPQAQGCPYEIPPKARKNDWITILSSNQVQVVVVDDDDMMMMMMMMMVVVIW